jgi:hypothetical protein
MKITGRAMYRVIRGSAWIGVALGSLALSAVTLSSSASASPSPLFPFFLIPPMQMQSAPKAQAAPLNGG